MSGTNKKFVFAYLFLVILPLAGLVGILRGGHNLKAPASIDGLWRLRPDTSQLTSLPCGNILAATPAKAFAISQSGRSFTVSLTGAPDLTGTGTLDGTTIRAILKPSESLSNTHCASGQPMSVIAAVDRKVNPSFLVGTLSVADCPTCAAVNFQAERESAPARQEGQ